MFLIIFKNKILKIEKDINTWEIFNTTTVIRPTEILIFVYKL